MGMRSAPAPSRSLPRSEYMSDKKRLRTAKIDPSVHRYLATRMIGRPASKWQNRYQWYKIKYKDFAPMFLGQMKPWMKLSVAAKKAEELPLPRLPEVAFVGRSNCGKSSLVNELVGRHQKSKVMWAPGSTQELNFWNIGNPPCLTMVDMPGYGFAFAPEEQVLQWTELSLFYLKSRRNLSCVFVLIDSRQGLLNSDREMLSFLERHGVKWRVVMTKTDTVHPKTLAKRICLVRDELNRFRGQVGSIVPLSAKKRQGLEDLRHLIDGYRLSRVTAKGLAGPQMVDLLERKRLKKIEKRKAKLEERQREQERNTPLGTGTPGTEAHEADKYLASDAVQASLRRWGLTRDPRYAGEGGEGVRDGEGGVETDESAMAAWKGLRMTGGPGLETEAEVDDGIPSFEVLDLEEEERLALQKAARIHVRLVPASQPVGGRDWNRADALVRDLLGWTEASLAARGEGGGDEGRVRGSLGESEVSQAQAESMWYSECEFEGGRKDLSDDGSGGSLSDFDVKTFADRELEVSDGEEHQMKQEYMQEAGSEYKEAKEEGIPLEISVRSRRNRFDFLRRCRGRQSSTQQMNEELPTEDPSVGSQREQRIDSNTLQPSSDSLSSSRQPGSSLFPSWEIPFSSPSPSPGFPDFHGSMKAEEFALSSRGYEMMGLPVSSSSEVPPSSAHRSGRGSGTVEFDVSGAEKGRKEDLLTSEGSGVSEKGTFRGRRSRRVQSSEVESVVGAQMRPQRGAAEMPSFGPEGRAISLLGALARGDLKLEGTGGSLSGQEAEREKERRRADEQLHALTDEVRRDDGRTSGSKGGLSSADFVLPLDDWRAQAVIPAGGHPLALEKGQGLRSPRAVQFEMDTGVDGGEAETDVGGVGGSSSSSFGRLPELPSSSDEQVADGGERETEGGSDWALAKRQRVVAGPGAEGSRGGIVFLDDDDLASDAEVLAGFRQTARRNRQRGLSEPPTEGSAEYSSDMKRGMRLKEQRELTDTDVIDSLKRKTAADAWRRVREERERAARSGSRLAYVGSGAAKLWYDPASGKLWKKTPVGKRTSAENEAQRDTLPEGSVKVRLSPFIGIRPTRLVPKGIQKKRVLGNMRKTLPPDLEQKPPTDASQFFRLTDMKEHRKKNRKTSMTWDQAIAKYNRWMRKHPVQAGMLYFRPTKAALEAKYVAETEQKLEAQRRREKSSGKDPMKTGGNRQKSLSGLMKRRGHKSLMQSSAELDRSAVLAYKARITPMDAQADDWEEK
uniref:EngB-type G domain-containing protein n=1 Tax=Chromera velia CCMP2878 TaxID=1169474 RepID=A0A0G4F324_9ALVE|eukprot:Cvel_14908.t1-p1 / transcript=Cvel_14908.t1 / gene=Cvel_14908 / organism=Chromera_velia_CCMP2878 / gene_product=GTP-binding protein EngB, putative / transcript_product=GTP-binding protein EngB, putative / location=Cvel_scaffold1080:25779-33726(-) / protein_length=1241 / sequence_SO=supercontig / SO=protein_coding / is_pseudo=false